MGYVTHIFCFLRRVLGGAREGVRALAQGKRDGARRRQVSALAGTQETVGGSGVKRSGTESLASAIQSLRLDQQK